MAQIHDKGYKKLFSNRSIFKQLIETFVHEAWVKDLDFTTCETLRKSFISAHYKETESDVIYKLKLKERDIFIYILIEFQSTVNRFMAVRLLNYITNFYMDYLDSNNQVEKLPPVFPILLYNGEREWDAPVKLSDLVDQSELLGKFSIGFEYFKLVEHEFTREELLKIRNIVSTLFLAESYYDIELLKQEFLTLFQREEDKQAVSLFLNWFKQLAEHQRIDPNDYQTLNYVYKNIEEVSTMLITALEKERKKIYEEGIVDGVTKGFEQGMEKGIRKANLNVIRNMLSAGISVSQISELTGVDETVILKVKNKK
jgi:predicted transposase/invertase (TIGR01784 family)